MADDTGGLAIGADHYARRMSFTVTTWTDYLCPWAYLGRPHSQWIRDQGVPVFIRAYELHPDTPADGRPIRPGGSYDRLLDRLGVQATEAGIAFTKPTRTPNTRAVLELLELVHQYEPSRSLDFDTALANAAWIDGRRIDDPVVLRALATEAAISREVLDRHEHGEGADLLDASRSDAIELEVSATPSWRIGELTISGVHHDEQFQRWAGKLIARNTA